VEEASAEPEAIAEPEPVEEASAEPEAIAAPEPVEQASAEPQAIAAPEPVEQASAEPEVIAEPQAIVGPEPVEAAAATAKRGLTIVPPPWWTRPRRLAAIAAGVLLGAGLAVTVVLRGGSEPPRDSGVTPVVIDGGTPPDGDKPVVVAGGDPVPQDSEPIGRGGEPEPVSPPPPPVDPYAASVAALREREQLAFDATVPGTLVAAYRKGVATRLESGVTAALEDVRGGDDAVRFSVVTASGVFASASWPEGVKAAQDQTLTRAVLEAARVGDAGALKAWQQAAAEVSARVTALEQATADLEAKCADGWAVFEPGWSREALVASRSAAEEAMKKVPEVPRDEQLLARADRMIERTDPAMPVEALRECAADRAEPGVASACLVRLLEVRGAAASFEALKEEVTSDAWIDGAIGALSSERRERIHARVAAARQRRWEELAVAAGTRESLAEALKLAQSCGADPDAVADPRLKSRMALLMAAEATVGERDVATRAASIKEALAKWSQDAEVSGWIKALDGVIEQTRQARSDFEPWEVSRDPRVSLVRLQGEGLAELRIVREGQEPVRLGFARVMRDDSGPSVYLQREEMSAGAFHALAAVFDPDLKVLRGEGQEEGLIRWLTDDYLEDGRRPPTLRDTRIGPRTLVPGTSGKRPKVVLAVNSEKQLTTRDGEQLAASSDAGASALPAQYVSAGAASWLASTLGCRLPRPSEWEAALASSREETVDVPRSDEWGKLDEAERQRISRESPGFDGRLRADRQRSAVTSVAWFDVVTAAEGTRWRHLEGNVRELLYEPEAQPDWIVFVAGEPPSRLSARIKEWVAKRSWRFRVAGVSVMAATGEQADKRVPVVDLSAYFAKSLMGCPDVGFRLALEVMEKAGASNDHGAVDRVVEDALRIAADADKRQGGEPGDDHAR
jgi:hypothetical protein